MPDEEFDFPIVCVLSDVSCYNYRTLPIFNHGNATASFDIPALALPNTSKSVLANVLGQLSVATSLVKLYKSSWK